MAAPLTHTENSRVALPCPGCTAVNGQHLLTCPTLQLPAYWAGLSLDEKYGPNIRSNGGRPAGS